MLSGESWLHEQIANHYRIGYETNYIDADLTYKTNALLGEPVDAGNVWVIVMPNNVIQIDKRCIDMMPDMPDTFNSKRKNENT